MTMTEQIREWARSGALARLQALQAERSDILREFPELGSQLGLSVRARRTGTGKGNRTPRTEEMRQKYSDAARARWAKRKAAEAAALNAPAPYVNDVPVAPAPELVGV